MKFHITARGNEGIARRLDAAGWGLFIIWAGIAILIDLGWGWTLFGVAAIILAGTAVRWLKDLPVEGFWVAMGLALLTCAIWDFFAVPWRLLPILIIGFGVFVLLSAFRESKYGAR